MTSAVVSVSRTVRMQLMVLTRQEFDRKRNVVCSLPATVAHEGKLLYAA